MMTLSQQRTLSKDVSYRVRRDLVNNPDLDKSIVMVLLADTDMRVRENVLDKYSHLTTVIETLKNDNSFVIKRHMLMDNSMSDDVLCYIMNNFTSDEKEKLELLPISSIRKAVKAWCEVYYPELLELPASYALNFYVLFTD